MHKHLEPMPQQRSAAERLVLREYGFFKVFGIVWLHIVFLDLWFKATVHILSRLLNILIGRSAASEHYALSKVYRKCVLISMYIIK